LVLPSPGAETCSYAHCSLTSSFDVNERIVEVGMGMGINLLGMSRTPLVRLAVDFLYNKLYNSHNKSTAN